MARLRPPRGVLTAGVDEVGRGPLAGPVVVAAVILRRPIAGLADSKQLRAAERVRLSLSIREHGGRRRGSGLGRARSSG